LDATSKDRKAGIFSESCYNAIAQSQDWIFFKMQILETKVSLFPGRRRLTFKKLNLDSSHVGNEGVHSLCLADDVITLTGPQELANADLKISSLDLSGNDFTESDELAAGPLLARLVRNHTK